MGAPASSTLLGAGPRGAHTAPSELFWVHRRVLEFPRVLVPPWATLPILFSSFLLQWPHWGPRVFRPRGSQDPAFFQNPSSASLAEAGWGEAMRGLRAPQAPLVPSLVWECHASLPKVPGQGGRLARPSCGETGLRRGRQEMGLLTSRPLPSDGPHFSPQVCICSDLRSTAQTCPAAFSLFIAVLANVCEVRHLIRLQVDQSVALVTFRKPCAATTLFPEFSTLLNRNQWLLSGHSASPPSLKPAPGLSDLLVASVEVPLLF